MIISLHLKNERLRETRLTYKCAHLRSTKESVTIEYLIFIFFVVEKNNVEGKYLEKKKIFFCGGEEEWRRKRRKIFEEGKQ